MAGFSSSSCSSDLNLLDDSNDDESSSTLSRPLGLTGLQNLGNTCYMNAALQALSNCPQLTGFMTDCREFVRKPGIAMAYQKLIQDMWSHKRPSYLIPTNVSSCIRKICPSFKGYMQHDAQEFLRFLLDKLHEDLKEPSVECTCCGRQVTPSSQQQQQQLPLMEGQLIAPIQSASAQQQQQQQQTPQPQSGNSSQQQQQHTNCSSIISEIFDGKILTCVQCLTCNNVSVTRETFQDLSLSIPTREQLNVLRASRSKFSEMDSRSDVSASPRSSPISMSPLSPAASSTSISSQSQQQQQQQDTYTWIWSWVEWFFSLFWGPTVELEDCLSAFFSADELKGDNMYSCEKCGKLRNGIKYSKVIKLPDILCIHLKRFRHEFMYASKILSQVTFPLEGLDMAPYMAPHSTLDAEKSSTAGNSLERSITNSSQNSSSNPLVSRSRLSSLSLSTAETTVNDTVMTDVSTTMDGDTSGTTAGQAGTFSDIVLPESNESTDASSTFAMPSSSDQITTYDLVAVICHHGTPASGHYIAYCLNSTSDTWYEFDDQYVTAVDPHQLASCEAYVLFYRKTNDEVCQRRLRTVELIERCNSSASDGKRSRQEVDIESLGRYYISNKWINRFNTFADPGPITNHDFLCEHQMVRPSQYKYVSHLCTTFSKEVWDYLASKYGGGPACTSLDVCNKCEIQCDQLVTKLALNMIHI